MSYDANNLRQIDTVNGVDVAVDNTVQTFMVKIRAGSPIDGDQLKRAIQTQYEVIGTPVATDEVDTVAVDDDDDRGDDGFPPIIAIDGFEQSEAA